MILRQQLYWVSYLYWCSSAKCREPVTDFMGWASSRPDFIDHFRYWSIGGWKFKISWFCIWSPNVVYVFYNHVSFLFQVFLWMLQDTLVMSSMLPVSSWYQLLCSWVLVFAHWKPKTNWKKLISRTLKIPPKENTQKCQLNLCLRKTVLLK